MSSYYGLAMPDIKAVTGGKEFVPMVAGGIAAPIMAGFIPGLGKLGPLAPLGAGALLAYFGKGALRQAGQGAVVVSTVGLVGPMLAGLGENAKDGLMEVDF